jgi:hypothetical protein
MMISRQVRSGQILANPLAAAVALCVLALLSAIRSWKSSHGLIWSLVMVEV